jgi:hypothetical protein
MATISTAAAVTVATDDFSDALAVAPLIIDPLADHVPAHCLMRALPGCD